MVVKTAATAATRGGRKTGTAVRKKVNNRVLLNPITRENNPDKTGNRGQSRNGKRPNKVNSSKANANNGTTTAVRPVTISPNPKVKDLPNMTNRLKNRNLCLKGIILLFAASLLLPGLLPYAGRILWLPACIGLVWLFVSLEGWRGDRLAQSPNLLPAACSTRFLTHHHYCLLRRPVALQWQNPLSRRAARCELRLCLPGRRAIAVHNLRLADCDALFFSSQKEEP